ncbi:MAG: hypothetical protein NTZ30_15825 [Planctomycetota bacterium]|nr:hypothetical protein [Planctomycetota bacterium]
MNESKKPSPIQSWVGDGSKLSGKMLGEIITWKIPRVAISHADLITGLMASDLDCDVVKEIAPRNAFARACSKLDNERIIRKVAEDHATISFQFTREALEDGKFNYHFESLLFLDKHSGNITSENLELEQLAKVEFGRCMAARTANDVTRLVQRLFERHADLFSIRDQGGVYFVPELHHDFITKVERFVRNIGGSLQRFPIPAGSPQGDHAVQEAVAHGLQAIIDEHLQAVQKFGADTRPDTLRRAEEKVRATKLKIEGYSFYLDKKREDLKAGLQQASELLRSRMSFLIGAPSEEAELVLV